MKKHTPGPWHTGGIFDPNSDVPTRNVWAEAPPGKQNGELIAQKMNLPNARLIAAAPDLLEALQWLYAIVLRDQLLPDTISYMTEARAAIAKATSGS